MIFLGFLSEKLKFYKVQKRVMKVRPSVLFNKLTKN